MIIDDKIQKILQTNDFQRLSRSQITEHTQGSNSIITSNGSKPKKRKVIKLKNSLLQSHVSPDIQRMYYQAQKTTESQFNEMKNQQLEQPKINQAVLPQIQRKDSPQQIQPQKISQEELINTLYEIFPPDHQLWNDLQIKNEVEIAQYQDYFIDLINLYMQEMDIKNLRDKKLQCKGKLFSTQYNDDYHQQQNNNECDYKTHIGRWIYDRVKQQGSFLQKESTYNQHFVPQKYEKINNFKPENQMLQREIAGLSSYNANYRDWKKQYHGLIGPFYIQSEKKLPFIAQSNYSRNFITQKYEKIDPIIPKPIGPFPIEAQSLVTESTSKHEFTQPKMTIPSIFSPRSRITQSYDGYQPHFAKANLVQQSESFAQRFFHSPVVQQLMKSNQKQKIN